MQYLVEFTFAECCGNCTHRDLGRCAFEKCKVFDAITHHSQYCSQYYRKASIIKNIVAVGISMEKRECE